MKVFKFARTFAKTALLKTSHYKLNMDNLKKYLSVDKDQLKIETENDSGFHYYQLELVPLDNIIPEEPWSEEKLDIIRENINNNEPLEPIHLYFSNNKYKINDGIHRYNVSKEKGFETIPAIVAYEVEKDVDDFFSTEAY